MSRPKTSNGRTNGVDMGRKFRPVPKKVKVCQDPECKYCLAFPDGLHRWNDIWDPEKKQWRNVQEQRPDGTILP